MYYHRLLERSIKAWLFKGKILVVYGARQVGKTTLVRKLAEETGEKFLYLNCDEADVAQLLGQADNSTRLREIIAGHQLVIIDEGQRVKDIGLRLKLIADTLPGIQVIATGSSSFDLANEIAEPLTGRHLEFILHSFSVAEMKADMPPLEAERRIEELMVYGAYPEVVETHGMEAKETLVKRLASDYLYKDVLKFRGLKKPEIIEKLLLALALQVGSEVSYTELAGLVGVSLATVQEYVDLLEKMFIVFRLPAFSRNLRKEIGKSRKIYFCDVGIRNALIRNFNPLNFREDKGRLWENFVIAERVKKNDTEGKKANLYFWRTYDQQEIDLIEEVGGQLTAFEIKWKAERKSPPKAWKKTYPEAAWKSVTRENFLGLL